MLVPLLVLSTILLCTSAAATLSSFKRRELDINLFIFWKSASLVVVLTVSGSERVEPRAESSRARFTYRA